jgi:hypothetical protein
MRSGRRGATTGPTRRTLCRRDRSGSRSNSEDRCGAPICPWTGRRRSPYSNSRAFAHPRAAVRPQALASEAPFKSCCEQTGTRENGLRIASTAKLAGPIGTTRAWTQVDPLRAPLENVHRPSPGNSSRHELPPRLLPTRSATITSNSGPAGRASARAVSGPAGSVHETQRQSPAPLNDQPSMASRAQFLAASHRPHLTHVHSIGAPFVHRGWSAMRFGFGRGVPLGRRR